MENKLTKEEQEHIMHKFYKLQRIMDIAILIRKSVKSNNRIISKRARFYSKDRYTKRQKELAKLSNAITLFYGAAQVSSIISQPIPRYPKGASGGISVVGDSGPEIIADKI
jgi:hypothetical protein